MLTTHTACLPPAKPLPGRNTSVPNCIVADEIFALKPYLMKPFPDRQLRENKRILSYRLSRARRIVENAFGILASRFGIFQSAISLSPEKVEFIVLAACALHNFLRTKASNVYTPNGIFDAKIIDENSHQLGQGSWRNTEVQLCSLQRDRGQRCTQSARNVQHEFLEYFNSPEGSVPWQWKPVE